MSKAVSWGVAFDRVSARRQTLLREAQRLSGPHDAGSAHRPMAGIEAGLLDALRLARASPSTRERMKKSRAKTVGSLPAAAQLAAIQAGQSIQTRMDSQMSGAKSAFFRSAVVDSTPSKSVDNLISSAILGRTDALEEFLLQGTEIDSMDDNGRTALWHSCRSGHIKCIELLANRGANVNHVATGHTPLMLCLMTADTGNMGSIPGDSPRIILSASDRLAAVEVLVEHSAQVDVLSEPEGLTPLHLAVMSGNSECLEVICAAAQGKQIDSVDVAGQTALQLAIANESVELCGILLKYGAKRHVKPDSDRWEGLFRRAIPVLNMNCVEGLLKLGIDANADAAGQETPLQLACVSGSVEIVTMLLEYGADPYCIDISTNQNALHSAAQSGNPKIVALVLDASDTLKDDKNDLESLVNLVDRNRCTPLHIACKKDDTGKSVKLILDSNDDAVNLRSSRGATPLHICTSGLGVESLVKHGGDVAAKDSKGRTPLDVAREAGLTDLFKLLGDHDESREIVQRVLRRQSTSSHMPSASELVDKPVTPNTRLGAPLSMSTDPVPRKLDWEEHGVFGARERGVDKALTRLKTMADVRRSGGAGGVSSVVTWGSAKKPPITPQQVLRRWKSEYQSKAQSQPAQATQAWTPSKDEVVVDTDSDNDDEQKEKVKELADQVEALKKDKAEMKERMEKEQAQIKELKQAVDELSARQSKCQCTIL